MGKTIKKPELLIPAGSLEVLKVAVDYGADAVYIGGKNYGLRAKAGNFTIEEMHAAADYVHAHSKKLYVTVNIFAHKEDIEGIKAYFRELKEEGSRTRVFLHWHGRYCREWRFISAPRQTIRII